MQAKGRVGEGDTNSFRLANAPRVKQQHGTGGFKSLALVVFGLKNGIIKVIIITIKNNTNNYNNIKNSNK